MTRPSPENEHRAVSADGTLPSTCILDVDVAVIGSGFAGSLLATILQLEGLRTAVIDQAQHPRFAIGESSTPTANLILADLADRYSMSWLKPLAKYGTWRKNYPDLACGPKRGFSYFQHQAGRTFSPSVAHANELMVAASVSNEVADTQWFRADVDHLLLRQACEAGVESFELARIELLEHQSPGWKIRLDHAGIERLIQASFLVDASGAGQVLPRRLRLKSDADRLATRSHAEFGHVGGLPVWRDILEQASAGATQDHPFACDDSALHHLLEEGWMWWLRFDHAITSVGFVFDDHQTVRGDKPTWESTLSRYPTLAGCFSKCGFTDTSTMPIVTPRLQRMTETLCGKDWALLPHTAGFVDPLHSTGIAQSLAGVERLAACLLSADGPEQRLPALNSYASAVREELTLIDQLVAGCYDALREGSFCKFVAYSMVYFAGATTWERLRRSAAGATTRGNIYSTPLLFCADIPKFRSTAVALRSVLTELNDESFERRCQELLGPFNHVGLFDPPVANMYHATALPG